MTMMRPLALAKISEKASPTFDSDIEWPSRSILVLSEISASTPSLPNSAKAPKSIGSPLIGVKSTLKSPVTITVPTGQRTAIEVASGTE